MDKGFIEMKTQMALPGNPSPAEEVRRVRVVRDAIGPDIKLMCDINQRWRVEQAIDIGHRVADVGLFWLEDVTTCDDYAGLARINAALSTPIAGGEYVWGITPFRQMIEARSVDYVMIDLCRVGGVTQWMKVAGMAEAFNLPVVSHVIPEMHLHLIAAVPNGLTVEYMPWMLKLYEETPAIEKGQLVLPKKPGLGLKFDEKAVAAYRVGWTWGNAQARRVAGPGHRRYHSRTAAVRVATCGVARRKPADPGAGRCPGRCPAASRSSARCPARAPRSRCGRKLSSPKRSCITVGGEQSTALEPRSSCAGTMVTDGAGRRASMTAAISFDVTRGMSPGRASMPPDLPRRGCAPSRRPRRCARRARLR